MRPSKPIFLVYAVDYYGHNSRINLKRHSFNKLHFLFMNQLGIVLKFRFNKIKQISVI